jgi:hypothetical protein
MPVVFPGAQSERRIALQGIQCTRCTPQLNQWGTRV